MIVINQILGNMKRDSFWQSRLKGASIDILALSQWEAQRSSCRKTTCEGQDLGISLARNQVLTDGDILLWDTLEERAVVVQTELRDILVIQIQSLLEKEEASILKASFELGHLLGNLHWKSILKDHQIYIPLVVSRKVMELVLQRNGFNLPYAFVKGETLLPKLAPSEIQALFGGADETGMHVHLKSDFSVTRAV
ncbi:urease accessory protein UreE [Acetobacteraceae bacterium]|nr:urease accessory protein UreE [Acetobacteraceae bacterium]